MKRVPSGNFHMTNQILMSHCGSFLWRVSGLPRAALVRPGVALPELDLPLHQRRLRVRPGELELDVAFALRSTSLVSHYQICRMQTYIACRYN